MKKTGFSTKCVHTGTVFDEVTGGTNSPVYPSTSFAYIDREDTIYPRYFNTPNQKVINDKMSALENGEAALFFSSGMAAISTTLFTFLKSGDHVVFQIGLYGGTHHFITSEFDRLKIHYSFTESNDKQGFINAILSNTRLIYIETPSNPLLSITDMKMVSEIARLNNIVTLIDNTFASPVNQNPIDFGIDVVLHSATKYISGHSDICAGVAVSSNKNIQKIYEKSLNYGGSLNAFTCHFIERSMKTLFIRVEKQNANAMDLATFLNQHPEVEKVYYPGLQDHPNYDIAKNQMQGFGGMLSFELKNIGSEEFQRKLHLIRPSMSLGGVDTIICAPAHTSHRHLSKTEREFQGISERLLRLSVGIEDVEDLKDDIVQALV